MSLEILEKVKEFLIRLVKDEDFRQQLMSEKIDEVKKFIADSGYNFSQEEFETATIKILELKELGEFHELTEQELLGAVGGFTKRYKPLPEEPIAQPMYGIIIEPIGIDPQPMYGIVIEPIEPIKPIDPQPMYGIIISDPELL
ncbi:Nif11-like leader peptide family RiPP precursor [Calothrix sp. NIES-2098]|uniref:Nif11-like leader peptide family RiPP precursor n=1 Tax=Calothrix sp. NIES-2098 TaxID=1954171 RepID=UPI000B617C64|nr:nitrogen fixation protein [Calothrix sp. NIES-2098]